MRVRKTIKIDKDEYVIRELTLREIIKYFQDLVNTAEKDKDKVDTPDTLNFMKDEIQVLLNLALEGNYKVEDLMDLAPSELKLLYDEFKEVNKVFFDTAAQMGMAQAMGSVLHLIQSEFSALLVNSSKAAITRSSSTGSPTS